MAPGRRKQSSIKCRPTDRPTPPAVLPGDFFAEERSGEEGRVVLSLHVLRRPLDERAGRELTGAGGRRRRDVSDISLSTPRERERERELDTLFLHLDVCFGLRRHACTCSLKCQMLASISPSSYSWSPPAVCNLISLKAANENNVRVNYEGEGGLSTYADRKKPRRSLDGRQILQSHICVSFQLKRQGGEEGDTFFLLAIFSN